jgi:Family of unknown function (DUF5995)
MTTWPTSMQALAARVRDVPTDREVSAVVDDLTKIERDLNGYFSPDGTGPDARKRRPPLPDGVACFNGMYLEVTKAVGAVLPTFENPAFIERLDVLFAEFYLEAYRAALAKAWVSKAWAPLFTRRDAHDVLALQFAVAGMNAHINNDLAHALVLTWQGLSLDPRGDTPERRDYDKVNAILEAVENDIKPPLSDAFISGVDKALGRRDDLVAMWSIRQARAQAWERAEIMRDLPGGELDGVFDRLVGFAGNLLLRPPL